MKNQKGFIGVLVVLAVVLAVAIVGLSVYNQNKVSSSESSVPAQYQTQYQDSAKAVAPIQDSKDLDSASTSLDSTSTTQLDSQLKLLDSDTSSF